MSNSIWQATIQNEAGDIIPGAEITVTDEDTGLPATIFSTIGGAAKANPFFSDSNGFAQFYAGSGTYRVNAEDTGTGQSQLWRYIRFGDAASRDIGLLAGNAMEVGSFGLGSNSGTADSNDPDVFNAGRGLYLNSSSDFTSAPFGSNPCHLIHLRAGSTASQLAVEAANSPRVAIRDIRGGSPGPWYYLYSTNNFSHLQNISGSPISSNSTIAGSNLSPPQSGTWLNVSGATISNNGFGLWEIQ